jgi:mevalonate pyrophosphate decarboxylase
MESHLAVSIPLDPIGDKKWAAAVDIIRNYRDSGGSTSTSKTIDGSRPSTGSPDRPSSSDGYASASAAADQGGFLRSLLRRPAVASQLDAMLRALGSGSGAAALSSPLLMSAADLPLAWLCDNDATPRLLFKIVDAAWPPDAPDQLRGVIGVA